MIEALRAKYRRAAGALGVQPPPHDLGKRVTGVDAFVSVDETLAQKRDGHLLHGFGRHRPILIESRGSWQACRNDGSRTCLNAQARRSAQTIADHRARGQERVCRASLSIAAHRTCAHRKRPGTIASLPNCGEGPLFERLNLAIAGEARGIDT